jgi:hypothetical protein
MAGIGAYAILFGVVMLMVAFRLRGRWRALHPD